MSIYQNELDEMLWSFSRISSYETCPYKFYLNYIEKREPKEENFFAKYGKLCHSIIERFYKSQITREDAIKLYEDGFEQIADMCKPTIVQKWYYDGKEYFETVMEPIKGVTILGVEQECRFKVGKHDFIGYIDLLMQTDDGDIIVVDHKSAHCPMNKNGAVPKSKEPDMLKLQNQLYLYSIWVHDHYGKYPSSLMWNHFRDHKIGTIAFNKEDFDQTIQWTEHLFRDIYHDDLFEPAPVHFFCTNLCDYRSSCEYLEDDKQ